MGHDVAVGTVAGRAERPFARVGWTAAVALTAAVAAVVVLDHSLTERDRVLALIWAAVWIGSGALVLLCGAPSRMSVLVASMLLANGLATPVAEATDGTTNAALGRGVLGVALTLSVVTLSVFPDGRFVPGVVAVAYVAGFALWQVVTVVGTTGTALDVIGGVVYFRASASHSSPRCGGTVARPTRSNVHGRSGSSTASAPSSPSTWQCRSPTSRRAGSRPGRVGFGVRRLPIRRRRPRGARGARLFHDRHDCRQPLRRRRRHLSNACLRDPVGGCGNGLLRLSSVSSVCSPAGRARGWPR